MAWTKYRRQVDAWLDQATLNFSQTPPRLVEAMRYCLLAPGKRLRPITVLMSAQACGGRVEDALPVASALEMIHTYSLVHDDLPAMDNDDLRRGRPTCHVKYDEATAILVGDALLTLAFETVVTHTHPPDLAVACATMLSRAAGHGSLIGGQFDDLAAENRVLKMEELESIHLRKTATLFAIAAQLGGMVAGVDAAAIQRLGDFGQCVGLAFQIVDDLLDVEGHENRLGKRAQKDKTRGKSTYPQLAGMDSSRRRIAELMQQAKEQLEFLGDAAQPLTELADRLGQRES